MDKYKYLLKNVGLLTLSSFSTKLISFLLVPLYTSQLSTAEFGTFDLYNTTIGLLIPILTVDIQDAVLRFALDENTDKDKVFSVGIKYITISNIIIGIFLIFNYNFNFFPVLNEYSLEFFMWYALTALNGFISLFVRGLGKIRELSISSVISSIIMISFNILFLLVLHLGLRGYFYATLLGLAVQTFQLFLVSKKTTVNLRNVKEVEIEMVNYSRPMIANAIAWWINGASDRYLVTHFCGIAVNGIYSVSNKIPTIIVVIQGIFGQAWSLSSVREFDEKDSSNFIINMYNAYNFILVLSCSVFIALDKPISLFLFANDFFEAWEYVPFLLLSTVFSGLAQYVGGLFTALKKSGIFARTSVITALVNVLFNIISIPIIGPIGAAISTAVAYFIMWGLRIFEIKKYMDLRINLKRDLCTYAIICLQCGCLVLFNTRAIINFEQFLFIFVLIVFYKDELMKLVKKIKNRI